MRCHHSSVVDAFVTRCCLVPEHHHKWLWQWYQALLLFVKPGRVSSSRETSASLSAGHCTPTVWCTDFNKDRQRSLFLSSKAHRAMSGCITPCVSVRREALNCEKSAMLACDKSISLKELLCWDSRLDARALEEISLSVLQHWLYALREAGDLFEQILHQHRRRQTQAWSEQV